LNILGAWRISVDEKYIVFRKIARRTIPKVYNEKYTMSFLDRPNYL